MLNEIFKGMDNAAEMINENFKNGSIVESGSNENGHFVKMINGLLICWGEVRAVQTNSATLATTWVLPSNFIDDQYFATSVNTSFPISANNNDSRMAESVVSDKTTTSVVMTKLAPPTTFGADDSVGLMTFAIGRWK